MLPVQDVIPSRRTPLLTLALIALSGAAAIYLTALSQPSRLTFLFHYGLVPAWATPWTVVTAQFVQPDLLSGVVNLLALWIFGDNLEDRLGRLGFTTIFLGGGAAASAVAIAMEPTARVVMPAAAGAVAAVMGAYLVHFPRSRVMVLVPVWLAFDLVDVPAAVIALGWLAVHVMRHAGSIIAPEPVAGAVVLPVAGMAAGALIGRVLGHTPRARNWQPAR